MEQSQKNSTDILSIKNMFENGMTLTVISVLETLSTIELKHYVCKLRKSGMAIADEWCTNSATGKRFKKYWLAGGKLQKE